MAKKKAQGNAGEAPKVEEFRHKRAKRKNNPPAKIAAEGMVPVLPKAQYSYSPRRPPVLRFDDSGKPDALPELLQTARERALTEEEARVLAEALRSQEPWLEWANKRELPGFAVDPVALNIHERISAQAILKVAARQDVQRSLFADPEQAYHEAVQFYKHDIAWTNRMILGDSLQVMSSLARREDLAGKVQMIYIDPPYGIKFASNFQPEIGRRDVKDKETDLTREPEMVKAYRDTWHLGIHSYLTYLRDRLMVSKELLADTGSVFVQIGDENFGLVRQLLDEIFGQENLIAQINFKSMGALGQADIAKTFDYLLWFARDRSQFKFRPLFRAQSFDDDPEYRFSDGAGEGGIYRRSTLTSSGFTKSCTFGFELHGRTFEPFSGKSWRTNFDGMKRLSRAERVFVLGANIYFKRYANDFSVMPFENSWTDPPTAFVRDYVVQTPTKFVERCMLMTTNPGDLVLDPTCGSGTTAHVAEHWGRRWITIDTSRVAISIARQRLLTAKFDRYRVHGEDENGNGGANGRPGVDPHPGFVYRTVPHITLKSIAQNANLDPIFAKHEPVLDERLAECNKALAKVTNEQRNELARKLVAKQREHGARSITDADRRRWELPLTPNPSPRSGARGDGSLAPDPSSTRGEGRTGSGRYVAKGGFEHWTVPFDTDPDWPKELQAAVTAYRAAWRAKMDEVNACIAANADQEELVDQPEIVKGVVRMSGPFTVEAVQPAEMSLGDALVVRTSGASPLPGPLPEGEGVKRPDPGRLSEGEGGFGGARGGVGFDISIDSPRRAVCRDAEPGRVPGLHGAALAAGRRAVSQ